jgi:amino acid permease
LSWDLILDKMKVCLRNLFRKKHSIINDLNTPLLRCLNLFDLILLSVSGMIGSGIYVLSGVVAKELTGPAIIIANLLAGFSCLFGKKKRNFRKRRRMLFF